MLNGTSARGAHAALTGPGGALGPERVWKWYLAMGLGLIAAMYLLLSDAERTWVSPGLGLIGCVATAYGAWHNRAIHLGSWLGLALGVLLLAGGDSVWAILSPDNRSVPTPSLADAVYLSGYAACLVSLASLAWPRTAVRDLEAISDVAIASLGIGLLAWVFLIQPATNATAGLDAAGTVVTMSYPVLDVALAIVLLVMVLGPDRSTGSSNLLWLALLAFLCSDLWYLRTSFDNTYVSGQLPDVGWYLGYLTWGAAGLHPTSGRIGTTRRDEEAHLSTLRIASLIGSCLLAPVMLIYEWANGRVADLPLIAGASVFLIMLWALRLAITVDRLRHALDERAELEGMLRERAERDVLVDLLNRNSFMNHVRAELEAGEALAVLFIDLDDFKMINDTFGHSGGDSVLIEISHRITALLRSPDIAARLGGDEFGVLLPGGDMGSAEAVAARILQNFARPVSLDGRAVHIEASIGISTGGPGKSAEDFIREADVAMYLAKGQGKNRFVVFEAAMHASVIRRMSLRSELEAAIATHQFTVVYQPVVSMPEGIVSDCEALVRWQHPVRGLLTPDEFIEIAEETGLIVNLGRWLLTEACTEAAEWRRHMGDNAPGVAVNVSALQVRHPTFATDIRNALEASGLPANRLVIELTESILIEVTSATSLVAELNDIGVRIAIDDFGTGYSSLAYLARYPVDMLKIDRSFVARLETGPREARLVSAIIALGSDLGLSVVAEGVETGEQLKSLLQHGCVMFQGYYFSRPMLGHDLEPLIAGAISRREPFTKNLLVPLERSA